MKNDSRISRSQNLLALAITLSISLLAYFQLLYKGLSSADDFVPIYYALYYDMRHPLSVFMTPYFLTYRPVPRLINMLTLLLPIEDGLYFNIKNLLFLLMSVVLVFLILRKLDIPIFLSAFGALLFSIHPAEVNSIGVSVFPNAFISFLFLSIMFVYLIKRSKFVDGFLVILTILGVMTYEAFLIVPCVFVCVYALRYFRSHESEDLIFLLIHLSILPAYYLIRINATSYVALAKAINSKGIYGLKSFPEVIQNIGVLLLGSGNVVDFLWFINPVNQNIRYSANLHPQASLWISILAAAIVFSVTVCGVVYSLVHWVKYRNHVDLLPPTFYLLFILSFLMQSIGSRASETYLGASLAFLAVSQVLLVHKILVSNSKHPIKLSILVIVGILLGARFVGVWHRCTILVEKSLRFSYMSENLRELEPQLKDDMVYFTAPCRLEKGYSIYGGEGLDMVDTYVNEFVSITLQRNDLHAERIEYDIEEIQQRAEISQVIVVSREGEMTLWDEAFVPYCSPNGH